MGPSVARPATTGISAVTSSMRALISTLRATSLLQSDTAGCARRLVGLERRIHREATRPVRGEIQADADERTRGEHPAHTAEPVHHDDRHDEIDDAEHTGPAREQPEHEPHADE